MNFDSFATSRCNVYTKKINNQENNSFMQNRDPERKRIL